MRVLFIGNSYIYFNDLPGIFTEISRRKDHDVEASAVARGGWTLAQHAASQQTLGRINQGDWDYVVLQEPFWGIHHSGTLNIQNHKK